MSLHQLSEIEARIRAAETACGRQPGNSQLIAICKQQPPERVWPIFEAGQPAFGEARVQEAMTRWTSGTPFGDKEREKIRLHLVGPLQTNKCEDAVGLFDVIHSLDRLKLARALAQARDKLGRDPGLFIQVNTGEEPQKSGIAPEGADAFIAEIREVYALNLLGLMCLPPRDEPAGLHFALLAKIAERNGLAGLSMGMSNDFETAIAFGATHLRIGSALFGERPRSAMGDAQGVARSRDQQDSQ